MFISEYGTLECRVYRVWEQKMKSEKMIKPRLHRALGVPKMMEFILYKIRKHQDFYKTYNFKIS